MRYRVTRDGVELGVHDRDRLREMFSRSELRLTDLVQDPASGRWMELSVLLAYEPEALGDVRAQPVGPARPPLSEAETGAVIRRLARYERISAVVWLVIAIVQILCVVTAVAGLWNIYACISRFRMARAIESRNPGVPAAYEQGLTWLIVMAAVNLALGGVFAVVWIGFDWFVRSKVLAHRHLFEGPSPGSLPLHATI